MAKVSIPQLPKPVYPRAIWLQTLKRLSNKSRKNREVHVRLCVLVYPGGFRPPRVKVSVPLAWVVAAVEVMKLLKPIDKVLESRMSEWPSRNANQHIGGSESDISSGRNFNCRVKTACTVEKLTVTAVPLDGVDGMETRIH